MSSAIPNIVYIREITDSISITTGHVKQQSQHDSTCEAINGLTLNQARNPEAQPSNLKTFNNSQAPKTISPQPSNLKLYHKPSKPSTTEAPNPQNP